MQTQNLVNSKDKLKSIMITTKKHQDSIQPFKPSRQSYLKLFNYHFYHMFLYFLATSLSSWIYRKTLAILANACYRKCSLSRAKQGRHGIIEV
jgi:hypothetical protein